ncbi:MAG: hypothetical protein ACKOWD_17795 [Rhodoferax sp.]
MNAKFTVRAIQQGQTQKTHTVTAGAGQNGQALVLQGAANTRYQLADMLTFTSPAKLQIKRAGKDLLVALPGNDVSTPDIVIRDYFEFDGMSLSGLAQNGEPMVYDISNGFFSSIMPGSTPGVSAQSLTPNQTTAASLAKGAAGWFDGGWGLVALGAGGLALAAAGGGSSTTTNASLSKITTYKADATKAVPSVTDFAAAGVSGVDASNITAVLSYFPRTQLPLDSAASVQSLVDSFKKVAAEANGTSADATPDSDPTATDYTNLMGANTPNSIATKPQALALLNDRVKALNATDVDTYTEIKALADAVEAVAQLAQSAPSTTGTAGTTGNITVAQLTSLGVDSSDAKTANVSAYSDAIRASADDVSTLNSAAKLTALVKAYNTILAEANGTAADATTANPAAADYAAIGADIGTAKTDADALARLNAIVGNLTSTAVDTVDEINKLAATLDKIQTVAALATGATLTDAQKFSVDELKNLGLTGFTGTDTQNTALALKVSEAIRDKTPAEVTAGVFAKGKLDTSVTPNTPIDWSQTQLERLQTLVSQEIIKNYVVDTVTPTNTTTAPTLTDWQNIGVFKPVTLKDTPINSAAQGYSVLSSAELAYLNSAADKLPASAIDTQAKAQAILEAYLRIIQEANGSDTDKTPINPTPADLALVGVTGDVTDSSKPASSLMLDVIANLTSTCVDTVTELQALANTATRLMAEAAKVGTDAAGSFTVTELSNLGLRGASATGTSSNLVDFLTHVRDTSNTGTDINTLTKPQSWLSLSVVQAWARDVNPDANASPAVVKTATAPTAQDYKDIGVVRSMPKNADGNAGTVPATLSPADLNALNDAIDTLVDNSTATTSDDAKIDSLSKVQAIATSYLKILNEANGSASDYTTGNTVQTTVGTATTAGYLNNAAAPSDVTGIDLNPNPVALDYTNIGVDFTHFSNFSTSTDNYISLLNTLIAEKSFGQVDTVKEIQTLATTVDKVLTLRGATGDLTLSELSTDLGLSGVNTSNFADVNTAIRTANSDDSVDSFAELQSLVSFTRIQRYADLNGPSGTGTGAANDGGALPTSATGNYTDDWKNLIGVTDELAANYSAYNSAVDAHTKASLSDMNKVTSLVTSYNKILAEANGSAADATTADPTTTDFANIGLDLSVLWGGSFTFTNPEGNGTAKGDVALKLFNDAVGELSAGAVSSLSQLTGLANTVAYLVNQASKANTATPHADPNVNPTATVSYDTGTAPTAMPGTLAADLTALAFVGASKIGDSNNRYNGSQYNYFEKENVWASIQNTDVGTGTNTLLSYAAIQAIVDKYAF